MTGGTRTSQRYDARTCGINSGFPTLPSISNRRPDAKRNWREYVNARGAMIDHTQVLVPGANRVKGAGKSWRLRG
ncbi:hypothetical protein WG66_007688 [Moniliophthora roreri]|nr:hypothetical protein WG66_007688 [Moniliophthora roreri]